MFTTLQLHLQKHNPAADTMSSTIPTTPTAIQPQSRSTKEPWEYWGAIDFAAEDHGPMQITSLFFWEYIRHQVRAGRAVDSRELFFAVLREYLSLGATAAALWTHMWQEHEVQRGQVLGDDHAQIAVDAIKRRYTRQIKDPRNFRPLHIRQQLAEMNFGGEFLFLLNTVFPLVIFPENSTIRENTFNWEIQQWIIEAATYSGMATPVQITEAIQTSPLYPGATGPCNFYRNEYCPPLFEYTTPEGNLRDVQLEPFGPRNTVGDVSRQVVCPSDGLVCTICLEVFGSDLDESPCCRLNACSDLFHEDCLDSHINASHTVNVECPNCRAKVCDARARHHEGHLAES